MARVIRIDPEKPHQTNVEPGKPIDPNRPVEPGRVIPIDVEVPCPWTPGELSMLIDKACRFIRDAKLRHGRQLGWEVGEHLYVDFYRERDDYIRWHNPAKEDSLYDIAPKAKISPETLRSWLKSAMMRHALARAGFTTPVPMSFTRGLYPLFEYVKEAVALARWAKERRLDVQSVDRLAGQLAVHLDGKGTLEDFLADQEKKKRKKKKKKNKDVAKTDELVVARIFMLACGWAEAAGIAPYLGLRLKTRSLELRRAIDRNAPPSKIVIPLTPIVPHDVPGPAVESPWTEAERQRLVGQAVSFIRECIRKHEFQFAMEVGGHLFNGLFKGQRLLYHRGGTWKGKSIQAIADDERVQISDRKLYACIRTYLLVEQFGRLRPGMEPPAFSIYKWEKLFVSLEDHPELAEVVEWIERERVPRHLVVALAMIVKPYLALGGDLDDLMPLVEGRGPDTPYKRMARMIDVAGDYLQMHPLPDDLRQRTLDSIDAFIASL
jgi:hypothetical protein